jgi:hypothetical protein
MGRGGGSLADPLGKSAGQCFLVMDHNVTDEAKRHWVKEKGRFVDFSKEGGIRGLRHGKATLFVNASIMDVWYKPLKPVWVVDCICRGGREKGRLRKRRMMRLEVVGGR